MEQSLVAVRFSALKSFDSRLLVTDGLLVTHQTRIGQSFVVQDLAFKLIARVVLHCDLVVGQCFIILTKIVVALASIHVEKGISTFAFDLAVVLLV